MRGRAVALTALLGLATVPPAGAATQVEVVPLAAVPLRSAALLLSGQEGGELPVRLACWPVPGEGPPETLCALEIALAPAAGPDPRRLEVAAYALDAAGGVLGSSAYGLALDAAGGDAAPAPGIATLVSLASAGAPAAVRVLVRELLRAGDDGRFALAECAVGMRPMVVGGAQGWRRVAWRDAVGENAPRARALLAALEPERPLAVAVAAAASSLRVVVGAGVAELRVGGSVVPARPTTTALDGSAVVEVALPEGLAGEVELGFGEDGAGVPVRLVEAGVAVQPWPTAGRPRPPSPHTVEALDASRSAVRREYVAALSAPAATPAARAAAVAALERSVAATGEPKQLARLGREQADVFAALLERDTAAAVALIQLHRGLFEEYLERRDHLAATHAQLLLVTFLARVERVQELAATAAADLNCVVAGDLQRHRAVALAERLAARAAELDPGHTTALLALGVARQARGDAAGALQVFEQILEHAPDDAEARLRRAVCRRQTGRETAAEEDLRRLLADAPSVWIEAVAAQELARLHLAAQDPAGAVQVLEGVVSRGHGDRQLQLTLAYALERSGSLQAAQRRLATAAALGPGSGESPRLRFARWPWERLATIQARVEAIGRAGAERLAAVLAEVAS